MNDLSAMKFEPIELPEVEWCIADGMFIKQMFMERAGIVVPQHSHTYDHTSLLATGSVRVWKNGELWRDIFAPFPILIEAGIKHTFMSLEPNTVVYCLHRNDRTGSVEILEESALPGLEG